MTGKEIIDLQPVLYLGLRAIIRLSYLPLKNYSDLALGEDVKWYSTGLDMPFNFVLMNVDDRSTAVDIRRYISSWMNAIKDKEGSWPNWVIGNHDTRRVLSRLAKGELVATSCSLVLSFVARLKRKRK